MFGPALEAVVANRLEAGRQAILEGDFLLPEPVTRFAEEVGAGRVRALFVLEEDEAQLAANYRARDGEGQPLRARTSWLKIGGLRAECERCGVPALPARPWASGLARALALLGEP